MYVVSKYGYAHSYGDNWCDVTVFDNEEGAKEFFENSINEEIEDNNYYIQKQTPDWVLLLSEEDSSWIEMRIEEKDVLKRWNEERSEEEYDFEYKCFTIKGRPGYVIIKDEFGDIVDYLPWMSQEEVKKHIDEYFKCE